MTKCDGCEYIQGGEEQFFKFHVKSGNVYGTVDLDTLEIKPCGLKF